MKTAGVVAAISVLASLFPHFLALASERFWSILKPGPHRKVFGTSWSLGAFSMSTAVFLWGFRPILAGKFIDIQRQIILFGFLLGIILLWIFQIQESLKLPARSAQSPKSAKWAKIGINASGLMALSGVICFLLYHGGVM